MKRILVGMIAMGMLAALVAACETAAKGPTDQELVAKVVSDWKAASTAKDLEKVMTSYSEKFQHPEYGDKAGVKAFIKEAMDMGYLENAQFNTDKAKTTIEKDTAKVYPIELKASFGSANIQLDLKKEGKAWMIVGMQVEQL